MPLHVRSSILLAVAAFTLTLNGCGTTEREGLVRESFSSDNTYSRGYPQSAAQACEAARRTLLSQGYVVSKATPDIVEGRKNFQPKDEVHEQLELRVSCVAQDSGGSLVFANAVQDRYALKKSHTSASVGVSLIGSVSLPVGSNDDSLVKVASVTVQDGDFYKAFFDRLGRYLPRVKPAPKASDKPTAEKPPQVAPAAEGKPNPASVAAAPVSASPP